MATLELAMPTIWQNEGGKANNPNDPGGATSYGISLKFLASTPDGDRNGDGAIDAADIAALSQADALRLYRLHFWQPNHFEQIDSQPIATKCFDLSVNVGSRWAGIITQRAVRAAIGIKLQEDGVFGNRTIHAINMCNPDKLLPAMKSESAGYYRSLVKANPKLGVFLVGWLSRAYQG